MTSDAELAARRVREGRYTFISPGVIALTDDKLGFRAGLLARDPDGHAVQLVAE